MTVALYLVAAFLLGVCLGVAWAYWLLWRARRQQRQAEDEALDRLSRKIRENWLDAA